MYISSTEKFGHAMTVVANLPYKRVTLFNLNTMEEVSNFNNGILRGIIAQNHSIYIDLHNEINRKLEELFPDWTIRVSRLSNSCDKEASRFINHFPQTSSLSNGPCQLITLWFMNLRLKYPKKTDQKLNDEITRIVDETILTKYKGDIENYKYLVESFFVDFLIKIMQRLEFRMAITRDTTSQVLISISFKTKNSSGKDITLSYDTQRIGLTYLNESSGKNASFTSIMTTLIIGETREFTYIPPSNSKQLAPIPAFFSPLFPEEVETAA
jgi:hypothetical protein